MGRKAGKGDKEPRERTGGNRGRPTAKRAAQIDEAIREAALKQFLEQGFEATLMDNVAAEAGISKGTLYGRYDSKEQLFQRLIEGEIDRLSVRTDRLTAEPPTDIRTRMRKRAETLIGTLNLPEYRHLTRLARSVSITFPEISQQLQNFGVRRSVTNLAVDLADLAARSELEVRDDVDWYAAANMFLHAISGWYLAETHFAKVPSQEVQAYCDFVVDSIMAGIAKR